MRVGLILDSLVDGYQNQLLLGVHHECLRQGVDLYCMVGGNVGDPAQRGLLYDLVGKPHFDGLVISGGTMMTGGARSALPAFLSRFAGIPLVCVGAKAGEEAGIVVDNASGVRGMVGHLVRIHGRKRIAFLRVLHPEGEERYQGYLAGLADAGLSPDPRLVVEGDFSAASGREAEARLRKESFDAVVGSCDWQAIGMMEALKDRGVRVPDDVAVVGFDDIVEARFMIPPLTTVRQPIRHLGAKAVGVLLCRLRGIPAGVNDNVPTTSCFRGSCGCRSGHHSPPMYPAPGQGGRGVWELTRRNPVLVDLLLRHSSSVGLPHERPWAENLVDALLADFQDASRGKFVAGLGLQLDRLCAGETLTAWHAPLMELRAACLPFLMANPTEVMHAVEIFEQAHVLVSLTAECAQGSRRIAKDALILRLHHLGPDWRESIARGGPTKALVEQLVLLGIPSVYVGLQPGGLTAQGEARLSFSYLDSRRIQTTKPRMFRAGEILPKADAPFRRHTMVVFALDQALGYCAVEMGPEETQVYGAIREHINVALHRQNPEPPGPA